MYEPLIDSGANSVEFRNPDRTQVANNHSLKQL